MVENKMFLELTSDPVFKAFMLSDNTKEYKAKLIHLITGLSYEDLLNATYVSKEFPVNNKKDKSYRSDIIVGIAKNILNLEMNSSYYHGLFIKNNRYINKIGGDSFDKGEDYLEMEDITQINFDDFNKYSGGKLVYEFSMYEIDTKEIEEEGLKSYHVDLDYLRNKCYNKEELNELEEMLQLFIVKSVDELRGGIYMEPYMQGTLQELERISQDEKIIGLYDAEKVDKKIRNTQIKGARMEGIEEGMVKGKLESQITIAKQMLEDNMNILDIAKYTNLSIDEIKKL